MGKTDVAAAVAAAENNCANAREAIAFHRGAIVDLDVAGLSARQLVLGYGVACRAKAFFDRRMNAIRKSVDALLGKKRDAALRAISLAEPLYWLDGDPRAFISVTETNGAFGKTVLSEAKAREVLATKRMKIARSCFVKVPRPPVPPPRFSGEKFHELVALGVVTQAEYDGCLEPATPSPAVTVDVPTEIEDALGKMLLAEPHA